VAIKNGSSYRMGFTYNLDIVGKGITSVKVINKGHFKLLLQLPDGKEEWFNYDQLTSTKKIYPVVKTVENYKTETPVVAKVEKEVKKSKTEMPVVVRYVMVKNVPEKIEASNVKPTKEQVKTANDELSSSKLDFEKLLEGEVVVDYKYMLRCVKRDLRVMLSNRGWGKVYTLNKDTPLREVLGIIQGCLPDWKEVKTTKK